MFEPGFVSWLNELCRHKLVHTHGYKATWKDLWEERS